MNLESLKVNTNCGKHIAELEAIYRTLDAQLEFFDAKMGIRCNCSSGTCCEHFVPELSSVEAEYLAYEIYRQDQVEEVLDRLRKYNRSLGVCPLYNKDSIYHCSFYQGRGLICRLFGAACFVDKNGNYCFRSCKWNNEKTSLNIEKDKGDFIPSMGGYGRLLEAIDSNENKMESIEIALLKAINKIGFLLSFNDSPSDIGA